MNSKKYDKLYEQLGKIAFQYLAQNQGSITHSILLEYLKKDERVKHLEDGTRDKVLEQTVYIIRNKRFIEIERTPHSTIYNQKVILTPKGYDELRTPLQKGWTKYKPVLIIEFLKKIIHVVIWFICFLIGYVIGKYFS